MSQDEELSRVWGHVVSTLESSPDITPRQIAFVRLARPLGLLDGTLLLAVGNDLTKDYLESRVRGEVTAALSAALDREARFAITVDPELAEDAPPALRVVGSGADQRHEPYSQSRDEREADEADARREARPDLSLVPDDGQDDRDDQVRERRYGGRNDDRPPPANRRMPAEPARLNPKYIFETFVIGSSQPVRARGRGRGRRGAGQGVQPAVHLRRLRAGQDPPAARDRPLRAEPLPERPGAVRELRGVHQRLHQLDQRGQGRRVPAPLPRGRRAPHRRHPVPAGQGTDDGGVLPHVQHAAQREQAGRDHVRPAAQAAQRLRGPDAVAVRVGPDHRRPAARPRDAHRDPAQEGRQRAARRHRRTSSSTSRARSRPTSASSRVR